MWVELEDVKSGRAQMTLEWREVSLDSRLIQDGGLPKTAENRDLAKCLLHVYVDSAKEVYAKGGDKPSPMAQLRVGQARSKAPLQTAFKVKPQGVPSARRLWLS